MDPREKPKMVQESKQDHGEGLRKRQIGTLLIFDCSAGGPSPHLLGTLGNDLHTLIG